MRILIATVKVPFLRGGAEVHAEGLQNALCAAGHEVEIVAVPFKWYPPERVVDHMLACRLFDLTESAGTAVDRVIGLKFPAYLMKHPNKVLWILHQHRLAYELWDHPLNDMRQFPSGSRVRRAVWEADKEMLPEARAIYANSDRVRRRLKEYCNVESTPLYHPPRQADRFTCAPAEDFFYFPSRLEIMKRQGLVLQALERTRNPVRVRFSGSGEGPGGMEALQTEARRLGVAARVTWLGQVSEEEKRHHYAHCLGVIFPPIDEDYGYVTLEAMLARKAVVTCTDSGGPLEFVVPGETGRIVEPTPEALAGALDTLWEDRATAQTMGQAGRARYETLGIHWDGVVERLTA